MIGERTSSSRCLSLVDDRKSIQPQNVINMINVILSYSKSAVKQRFKGNCYKHSINKKVYEHSVLEYVFSKFNTLLHQIPLTERTFRPLLFIHYSPFCCLRRTW